MSDEWNVETGKKGRMRGGEERRGRMREEMQAQYIFPATPRTLKGNQVVPYNNALSSFNANRCILPGASPSLLGATSSSRLKSYGQAGL